MIEKLKAGLLAVRMPAFLAVKVGCHRHEKKIRNRWFRW
jgi:hypothetical protein